MKMTKQKLTTSIIVSTLIFCFLTILFVFVLENATVTNDIALGQMQNSDEAYILMEKYNQVRTTSSYLYAASTAAYVIGIVVDVYNYIKYKEN